MTVTFTRGLRPDDPSEPAATRALLAALHLDERAAEAILGLPRGGLALHLAGGAHVTGAKGKFSWRTEAWTGGWVEMAEALCLAAIRPPASSTGPTTATASEQSTSSAIGP